MRLIFYSILFIFSFQLAYSQDVKENTLSKEEIRDGWILLFDGKSTNGWTTSGGKPVPEGWLVNADCITTVEGGKGGDIVTVNEYKDFDFKVDFKIQPGCNSGIKYFYSNYTKGGNLGMEYQILDDVLGEDNKKENHLCGSLYDVLPPNALKKVNPPGQWNSVRIVCKGKSVEHWLNGQKILEFTRGSENYTKAVSGSKFNKSEPAFGIIERGRILLQEHGGVASFKNIKIKLL